MKNILFLLAGLGIGLALVAAFYGPWGQNKPQPELPPALAEIKADLEHELALSALHNPQAPKILAIIESLTPEDLQKLATISAQDNLALHEMALHPGTAPPSDDPALLNGLSPAANIALPLLLAYDSQQAHREQEAASQASVATGPGGVQEGPHQMNQAQAEEYMNEIKTNTFEAPLPPSNLPPLLKDPTGADRTEDNWLARLIAQDVTRQVVVGLGLKQPLSGLRIQAEVNDDEGKPHVTVDLMPWLDDPDVPAKKLNQALPIDFAWDPLGYSVLAEYLIGRHALPAASTDPKADGLLADLLDLNGPRLAREDVRVSALLQKNPLDASAQGEAALLLAAMAWRENAGDFSDNRRLLCKATAHLALAYAIDSLNHQAPDWNMQVADAALRTLAGRETDALQHIDALTARPDAPDAAKTWLASLRLWATHDWRPAKIDASSPLLVKIAWFQVLCDDLPDLGATAQLDATGDLAKIPDWGRALMGRPLSVENGNRFAQATIGLELEEASEVAKAENEPLEDQQALAKGLASDEDETVTVDQNGTATFRVIGPGTFLAASGRHLLNAIRETDRYLRQALGVPDEAAQFEAQTTSSFQGMPHFIVLSSTFPHPDGSSLAHLDDTLRQKNIRWTIPELPAELARDSLITDNADSRVLNDFYNAGEPCGTVYEISRRCHVIDELEINPRWHISDYSRPAQKAIQAFINYYQQLQALAPDSPFVAEEIMGLTENAEHDYTSADAIDSLSRFMDYSIEPFDALFNSHPSFDFSDEQRVKIYTKEAVLKPDVYFRLGILLRKEGRDDEAAEADRKGAASAYDQVGVANSVGPLVDYDMAHGKSDEALAMAKRAADVYSEQGILTYVDVLQKLNRLDEAEKWAKNLQDRYDDNQALISLYETHPDHFSKQADDLKKKAFPQGQTNVSINSFSGPPDKGTVFTSASELLTDSGMEPGDVVVALNSIKVESTEQYDYVRAQMTGSDMDLIVWHDNEYREIHASPPQHRFYVEMQDYPPR